MRRTLWLCLTGLMLIGSLGFVGRLNLAQHGVPAADVWYFQQYDFCCRAELVEAYATYTQIDSSVSRQINSWEITVTLLEGAPGRPAGRAAVLYSYTMPPTRVPGTPVLAFGSRDRSGRYWGGNIKLIQADSSGRWQVLLNNK